MDYATDAGPAGRRLMETTLTLLKVEVQVAADAGKPKCAPAANPPSPLTRMKLRRGGY
jgi:hypothetical protein